MHAIVFAIVNARFPQIQPLPNPRQSVGFRVARHPSAIDGRAGYRAASSKPISSTAMPCFQRDRPATMTLAGGNTMLNALPAPILLDIAIIFTALSWGLGFYVADKRVYIFASLA